MAIHAESNAATAERREAAGVLIQQGVTVVPYRSPFDQNARKPGKEPCAWPNRPKGERMVRCKTTRCFDLWLKSGARIEDGPLRGAGPFINLAALGLAQVDADDADAVAWAREYGVTRDDDVWIIQTRRGWRALYRDPDDDRLTLQTKCFGIELDLLVHVPAIVPPSIHPSGFHYRWIDGHSPAEIPYDRLAIPPVLVREKWAVISEPKEIGSQRVYSAQPGDLLDAVLKYLAAHSSLGGVPTRDGEIPYNCPFPGNHPRGDQDPSFWINPAKGVWICRSSSACGGGGILELANRLGIEGPRVTQGGRRVSRPLKGPTSD